MRSSILYAAVALAGAIGCGASIPPPNDAWAAAQADVGRAEASGAAANPDAKLQLQLAREDLHKAKALIGNDNERATTLTELARTEAQLARSLTNAVHAQDDAHQAATELQKQEAGK
ncbi:MAG TPA: DUF4398 domain-containing protein [Polyangiaceae bacterium]